jgi:protein involved in polysaccharide export with SLBB domain
MSPQGLYLRDGMSLKEAIAMVGGLRPEAKADAITIWRKKADSIEPEKLVINYNDIRREKAKDIALKPYDIIEIKDNSRSVKGTLRGMLMGGGIGAGTTALTSLPLRILY